MKILVRNLSKNTTEDQLRKFFEAYGKIQYCTVILDSATGASKGFAFVEMPKPGEAKAAIKNLNGKEFQGNRLRVKKAVKTVSQKSSDTAKTEQEPKAKQTIWPGS